MQRPANLAAAHHVLPATAPCCRYSRRRPQAGVVHSPYHSPMPALRCLPTGGGIPESNQGRRERRIRLVAWRCLGSTILLHACPGSARSDGVVSSYGIVHTTVSRVKPPHAPTRPEVNNVPYLDMCLPILPSPCILRIGVPYTSDPSGRPAGRPCAPLTLSRALLEDTPCKSFHNLVPISLLPVSTA